MTTRASAPFVGILISLLLPSFAPTGRAGSMDVTVVDARDRQPIAGAFVMIGPSAGIPFSGNTGSTGPAGTIRFESPALVGPQTVTAGASGRAFFSVIDAAEMAVTIPLSPSVADTTIYGPKARAQGSVTGIAMTTGDGNLDAAIVLPAMTLDEIIGAGSVQYDAPVDSLTLPLLGQIYVPGNMAIPSQMEFFMNISKPVYHLDLRAQTTQTLYAVAARIPISALLSGPLGMDLLKVATVRELGVERDQAIGAGLNRDINADINLSTQLTVRFEGAPPGTQILAASLGSIPGWDGFERVIGYDTDTALVDSLDTLVLASWNPVPNQDISDVSNFITGFYSDSSAYKEFASGRVDRNPFTMPVTRVLRDFYDPPQLVQQGAFFAWDDVAAPATEPAPTWVFNSVTTGPVTPSDPSVGTTLVWQVAVPAAKGGFTLPSLPADAPGPPSGLPDVEATPEADRLIWDAYIANPAGSLTELLERPSAGVTHFSRRARTLNLRPADVGEASSVEPSRLRAIPNPSPGAVLLRLDPDCDGVAAIEILDPQGRRVLSLPLSAGVREAVWDGRDASGRETAPGIYFARPAGGESGTGVKLQRLR